MKKIALALLAAGASRRFGEGDKLLAPWRGRALIDHTLETYWEVEFSRRLAIVRNVRSVLATRLRDHGYEIVQNDDADTGLASSIALAAKASREMDGLMIAMGDMPKIKASTPRTLLAAFCNAPDDALAAPLFQGRRGHPVLFSNTYFGALAELQGDRGASVIIERHKQHFLGVDVEDEGVLLDLDTPSDFKS